MTADNTYAVGRSPETAGLAQATFNPRKRSLWEQMWRARTSYLMLMPFLIPFVIFVVIPVISSAYMSLTNYTGVGNKTPEFIGFQNYSDLLTIEIKEFPRLIDEATGEEMFACGRTKVIASEVAAYQAENPEKACVPAFIRPREVLSEGFSDYDQLVILGKTYIIGAKDPRFIRALVNTTVYVFYSVIIKVIIGLFLALTLRIQSRFNYFFRVLFFLPSVTATIAVTVIWGYIFKGQSYGLVNAFLMQAAHIQQPIPFLNDATYTMSILVIMAVWGGIGYNMIIFLAGLQNIPAELYEAAAIDGADSRQRLFYLTLPLLRPTFLFVIVTGIIGAFQVFEPIYILFATAEGMGGALDSALTVVPYLYDSGFRLFQFGYASAIAWILFIIIFALTLLNLQVGRANEAY